MLVVFTITFSSFDVVVHATLLRLVLAVCGVVHNTLVPPFVQFDVNCACGQFEYV
jgi:hypothetical protein